MHSVRAKIRQPKKMKKSMIGKTLATLAAATGAATGVTACTPAVTACTVRHHYAIVIFENGGGSVGKNFVTPFRLNVRYSPYYVQHWIMKTRIALKPPPGNQLPAVLKTYRVGHSRSRQVAQRPGH